MEVIVTLHGSTILISSDMIMLPRIGELIYMHGSGSCYEVKNVIWHVEIDNTYVEVEIE